MTLDEITKRVAMIWETRGDAEIAHSEEDRLYLDVLRAIAEGEPEAQAFAVVALTVSRMDFPRWHA